MGLFYVHDLPANMQWQPETTDAATSETLDERPVAPA